MLVQPLRVKTDIVSYQEIVEWVTLPTEMHSAYPTASNNGAEYIIMLIFLEIFSKLTIFWILIFHVTYMIIYSAHSAEVVEYADCIYTER